MEAAMKNAEGIRRLPGPSNFRPIPPEPKDVVAPLRNVTLVVTLDIVVQAKRYIASGATKGMVVEWRDVTQKGLVLRLTSTAATWYLRGRTSTLRIGTIYDTSVLAAREMARKASSFGSIGDARIFLEKVREIRASKGEEAAYYYEEGMWIDDDGTIHGPEVAMPDKIWTWSYLRKQFLEHKLPSLEERWASQYEVLLHHPCFRAIEHKPVGLLDYEDLEKIRDELKKSKTASQASRTISIARSMLDWAYAEHASRTGLAKLHFVFWERWKIERKTGTRDHAPTITELARTLVLVEHLHSLSRRSRGKGTVDATLVGALWGLVLTGQRIGQLLRTPTGRLLESPKVPVGWQVLTWRPGEVKKVQGLSLPHWLPLPPETIAILGHWRSECDVDDSDWMFPSLRGSGPVSEGGLAGLLRRLQGIRHTGKFPDRGKVDGRRVRGRVRTGSSKSQDVDLLARHEIEPWIPHDVRRTIVSFLGDHGLGGAASAIVAHRKYSDKLKLEYERESMLPVTELHYNRSQKLGLKVEGMTLWTKAILDAYEVEKGRFAPGPELQTASGGRSWGCPAVTELGPTFEQPITPLG
jgi:hypothetical protein